MKLIFIFYIINNYAINVRSDLTERHNQFILQERTQGSTRAAEKSLVLIRYNISKTNDIEILFIKKTTLTNNLHYKHKFYQFIFMVSESHK